MATAGTAIVIQKKPSRAMRAALAEAVSYLQTLGYEAARVGSSAAWKAQPGQHGPDFILVGSDDVDVVIGEIKQVRARAPRAQVLVAVESLTARRASDLYRAGATVVAPAGVFAQAVRSVMFASGRVEERASRAYRAIMEAGNATRLPLAEGFVEGFHDDETGRLDAGRVADAYGVSLSALARGLKITQSALSKRPTAAAAQVGLRELEFVWATLLDVLGTDERVRAWLNAKSRHLGDRAPIDLLVRGSAEALGNYVRSVITGEPG